MSIPISKQDFLEWREHKCTQELKASLLDTISIMGGNLLNRESSDPYRDQFEKGYIQGLNASVEWTPDLTQEEGSSSGDEEEEQ